MREGRGGEGSGNGGGRKVWGEAGRVGGRKGGKEGGVWKGGNTGGRERKRERSACVSADAHGKTGTADKGREDEEHIDKGENLDLFGPGGGPPTKTWLFELAAKAPNAHDTNKR